MIIGTHPKTRALIAQIERYAPHPLPVLITGETGTGKELVARALHDDIYRADGRFVAVNCGAIPQNLVEAELFGTVQGAYTGARDRDGAFRAANGGTLFLDEVGDLSLKSQAALLRVLEDGQVWPVGADRGTRVHVRVVAATNRNIGEMVQAGTFRLDLYHRLAVLAVCVPPLRDRMSDIVRLVEHFLPARTGDQLSPEAWTALRAHSWPGNVRELKAVIEAALVESNFGRIGPEHLRLRMSTLAVVDACQPTDVTRLDHHVAEYVRAALASRGGNVTAAAAALGISRTTLYRHISLNSGA
jgi:transcriptional regulator with PAS, ATPase and Fis domain